MNVTLVAKPDNSSQNILIEDFPFLIGRDRSPFSQYMQISKELNEAVHHISRRHATIFHEQGRILVKDMGSKNGTRINDRKLGEAPVEIHNGDILGISKHFEYTVSIQQDVRTADGFPFSLTLQPEDARSGLRAIDITSCPFSIGRREKHFRSYEETLPEQVVSLSRKHARITCHDNRVYLEDLGSTNGTTLGGAPVGRSPKPIGNGDHIVFGHHFKYRVRLIPEDVEETIALHSQTMEDAEKTELMESFPAPEDTGPAGGMEEFSDQPMAVPVAGRGTGKKVFYVGATREASPSGQVSPEAVASNATDSAVQDEGPEAARAQVSGLGGTALPATAEAEAVAPEEETGKSSSTVYMSSATQFLKIMTSEDKEGAVETDAEAAGGPHDTPSPSEQKTPSRIMGLFKEIYTTLWGTPVRAQYRKWATIGVAASIMAVAGGWAVVSNMPQQKLKKFMAAGQYLDYLKLSAQVLASDPGNEEVRRNATEALMKACLPDFSAAIDQRHMASAKQGIGSYDAYAADNPDVGKSLELLNWITDLESYFIQNDPDKPINLFRDEVVIAPLVARWNANEDEYRSLMDRMVQRSDAFAAIRGKIYHHLNRLKLKAVYFDSVKELNRTIQAKVDGQRNDEILQSIDEYQRRHPKVEGLSVLRREAEQYQNLDRLIRDRDIVQISSLIGKIEFQTPVFSQKFEDLKKNILPEPDMGFKLDAATRQWAAGDAEKAMNAIEPLTDGRWGDLAEAKLSHYRRVMELVQKVDSTRGTPEQSSHVLALRRVLDPREDRYYVQLVEGDFAELREQELQKSLLMFEKAAREWTAYEDTGRITGMLRLEPTVSKKFRQRAQLLKSSFEQSRSGVQIYHTLDITLPSKWERLNSLISDEVVAQRLRIEDLAAVLGPDVATAKLALLPSP